MFMKKKVGRLHKRLNIWIKERIQSGRFHRIFTVAFLLLLAPERDFNPAWPIFKPCGAFISLQLRILPITQIFLYFFMYR